jgi:hypothetical protein
VRLEEADQAIPQQEEVFGDNYSGQSAIPNIVLNVPANISAFPVPSTLANPPAS